MKAFLAAIVTLLLFSVPVHSIAAAGRPGPYFSAFLGPSIFNDITFSSDGYQNNSFSEKLEFDTGINIGGTGGYDFGFMRVEGEMSYKYAEIDTISSQYNKYDVHDSDLGVFATMINVFFDLHNDSPITPYLGGGIGAATLTLSRDTGCYDDYYDNYDYCYRRESDDTVFAYQLGGGVDIAFNNRFSLDVGYRYFKTDTAHFDSYDTYYSYNSYYRTSSSTRFESHNALIGFKMKF